MRLYKEQGMQPYRKQDLQLYRVQVRRKFWFYSNIIPVWHKLLLDCHVDLNNNPSWQGDFS